MPFKKISEPDSKCNPKQCRDPEHNPPGHIVLQPGKYEYSCPSCKRVVIVNIPEGPWLANRVDGGKKTAPVGWARWLMPLQF